MTNNQAQAIVWSCSSIVEGLLSAAVLIASQGHLGAVFLSFVLFVGAVRTISLAIKLVPVE